MPAAAEVAAYPLRVRLAFDDVGLNEAFLAEGKHRCWYLLPSAVKTVAQLADRLVEDFGLATSSGLGLLLQVEGYTLLHTLAIGVVRDGDTIIVKRRYAHALDNGQEAILAIEAAPKLQLEGGDPALKPSKKKKRKHASVEELPQQEQIATNERTSAKKKKHKQNEQLVDAETIGAVERPQSKRRKHKCEHGIEEPVTAPSPEEPAENGRAGKAVGAKKAGKVKDVQEPTSSEPEQTASDHVPSPKSKRLAGSQSDEDAHATSSGQHPSKIGPSRSARRKAFKRRRKREEKAAAEAALATPSGLAHENVHPSTPVPPAQPVHSEWLPRSKHVPGPQDLSSSKCQKGGHVRFQSDSEEDNQEALGAVQEVAEKAEIAPSTAGTADDTALPISVDSMPLLATQPQSGDIIAFKYLELTSAWNPELSDFKEAAVLQYDASTNQVALRPHFQYTGQAVEDNEVEDAFQTPPSVSGLLSVEEDGSWKLDYGSLLEVHLKHGALEGRSPMPTPLATTCPTATAAASAAVTAQATTQDTTVVALSQTATAAVVPAASASAQQSVTTTMQAAATPLDITLTAEPWKHFEMLASQLQQRRMELAAKSGNSSTGDAAGQHYHAAPTQVSVTTVPQGNGSQHAQAPLPAAAGIGRSAVRQSGMRAGAIGPLLTMLRAQQELS